jgi:xanthine dehydrogenase YagS FAD-binding subunit
LTEERVIDARLVLGGVAHIPLRESGGEHELPGAEVSAKLIVRAAEAALFGAAPLRHNAYKISLAKALIWQALTSLTLDGIAGIC